MSRFELLIGRRMVPDFTAPRPEDVDLEFIRYRLARITRFSGHPLALSVAQHQAVVATMARGAGEPEDVVRWAEHHDDHEAVLGDTVMPIKALVGDVLHPLEAAWDAAIAGALAIPLPTVEVRARVKVYDLACLRFEWRWILGRDLDELAVKPGLPPDISNGVRAAGILISALGSHEAGVIWSRRSDSVDRILGAWS